MGSHNGIKVNGKQVKKALLKNEDVIEIGNHKLIFQTLEENGFSASESQIIFLDEEDKDDQKVVESSTKIETEFNDSGRGAEESG